MKPLVTNQRVLAWFNVCPVEETASKNEKMWCVVFSVIVPMFELIVLIGSVLFFVKNWSINIEDALLALFQIDIAILTIYITIAEYILQKKISDIFGKLTEICNKRNTSILFKFKQFMK